MVEKIPVYVVCTWGDTSTRISRELNAHFEENRPNFVAFPKHALPFSKNKLQNPHPIKRTDIERAAVLVIPGPIDEVVETGHGMGLRPATNLTKAQRAWRTFANHAKFKRIVPFYENGHYLSMQELTDRIVKAMESERPRPIPKPSLISRISKLFQENRKKP